MGTRSLASRTYPDSVDAVVEVYDAGAPAENTPAAFFNLVGAIDSDSTDVLMDMVTVIDPDPGEDMLVEQTATSYRVRNVLDPAFRHVGIHARHNESNYCSDGSGRQSNGYHSNFVG